MGVNTLVIMSPTIYRTRTGQFNNRSLQVPIYAQTTLLNGHGVIIGTGQGTWDHVHVEDLGALYELALLDIIKCGGRNLPFGKKGIIFSGAARHTWQEISEGVTKAAYEAGAIKTTEVKSFGLEEGSKLFHPPFNVSHIVDVALSSNSRTKSTVAKQNLGWKPTHTRKDREQGFKDEVDIEIRKQKSA